MTALQWHWTIGGLWAVESISVYIWFRPVHWRPIVVVLQMYQPNRNRVGIDPKMIGLFRIQREVRVAHWQRE